MREIALEVGVQAGAIYNHCPNKQALLTNLLADHMQALLDAWNEIDLPKDPAAQLEAFVRFHIQYHLQRPDQVFISYMELRNLEPDNFKQIEVLRRKYEAVPKNILAAGQMAGQFNLADTHVAAMAILAQLTGVTTWYREQGRLSQQKKSKIFMFNWCASQWASISMEETDPCSQPE